MGVFILVYIIVGFGEYIRVGEDYREKLREDFPFHPALLLEFCISVVCLIFGPPLLIIKVYTKMKKFFKNLWRKITLPFRLRRFGKKLNQVSDEKDAKKSVEMLFDAMKEIMK